MASNANLFFVSTAVVRRNKPRLCAVAIASTEGDLNRFRMKSRSYFFTSGVFLDPVRHLSRSIATNARHGRALRQLRDVRRELQDALHERDVAVAKTAKVEDLEDAASELRRQNKELEDQVGSRRDR